MINRIKKYVLSENYCIKKVADLVVLIDILDNKIIGLDDNVFKVLEMLKNNPQSIDDMLFNLGLNDREDKEESNNNLTGLINAFNSKGIIVEVNDEFWGT